MIILMKKINNNYRRYSTIFHAKFSLHLKIGFNALHSRKAAHKASHFSGELQ
jgi:hypothetical protein